MTDVKALILAIIQPLVNHPEDIQLIEHELDQVVEYQLKVNPADVGHIVGRGGRVAKAIRTIVYGVKTPENKRVRLNIIDA